MNNSKITVEHIIAKIDNDFNPDNSDWIPRVAAWCTDAMNQLKVLNKVDKAISYKVVNRIAKSPCCFDNIVADTWRWCLGINKKLPVKIQKQR